MYWTNYHSHNEFCDGTDKMEAYIHEAISQKVKIYGFSSHAPLTFPVKWCMSYDKVSEYLETGAYLKQKFRDLIEIYLGMEVDYIPGITGPTSSFIQSLKMDYVIGSIHFVDFFEDGQPWEIDGKTSVFKDGLKKIFKGNIKKAISRYYELTRQMLDEQYPKIVGHLDKIKIHNRKKIFFEEEEKWYQKEVIKTLHRISRAGSILEVNTRGIYKKKSNDTYPSPWILANARELKIPIVLNSDAHHPSEITQAFSETATLLKDIGFQELMVLVQGNWESRPFNSEGIDLD